MSSNHEKATADHQCAPDPEFGAPWRRLCVSAFIAMAVHFIAGLTMLFWLRQGLVTGASLAQRTAFIAGHTSLWILAWLPWNCASLSILFYFYCFCKAHGRDRTSIKWLLKFALLIALAAVAIDLSAEAIEMGVLPDLARSLQDPHTPASAIDLFQSMDQLAMMLTGCIANALYTIVTAMLIFATLKEYKWPIIAAGTTVLVSGAWLSLATVLHSTTGMVYSNVLLLPALLLWQLGVATTSVARARTTIAEGKFSI